MMRLFNSKFTPRKLSKAFLVLAVAIISLQMSFPFPHKAGKLNPAMTTDTKKYKYIGASKCASECHNNEKMGFQYDIWKNSPHADSYNVLRSAQALRYAKKAHVNGNPTETQACLKCHITAEGLDSTYIASTYIKAEGITCEACHKHPNDPKTFLPAAGDCQKCHNNSVNKIRDFSFGEYASRIAHPRPKKT